MSYFGVSKFCRNNAELFLDTQHPSGYVPRTFREPRLRQHFKPFLAQTVLLGCRQNKDYRWVSGKYYEKLKNYLEYWFWYCDADRNGLCYWDGSDASGMDNQERRLGHINVMEYEGVDLNCYLVRELDAMAEIANALGRHEDAVAYTDHAKDLRVKIDEVF